MKRLANSLVDAFIRHKAALHAMPLDRYSVRIARSPSEYYQAFRLLRVAYVMHGYEAVRDGPIRITPHHLLPESTVLVAYEGDTTVGTMTVTLDSEAGLPIDHANASGLEGLRRQGARVVEYGSLAVVERCHSTGVTLLLNMAAYRLSLFQLAASHCVCTVQPRAFPVYRALFDFSPLGEPKPHEYLDMTVLGLVHDLVRTQAFVRRHFRRPMSTGRMPVDCFLGERPDCIQLPDVMPWERFVRYKTPGTVDTQLKGWLAGADAAQRAA